MKPYYIHISIQLLMLNLTVRSCSWKTPKMNWNTGGNNNETAAATEKIHDAVE